MTSYDTVIETKMQRLFATLSEKDKRRYAGIEAAKLGHGDIDYISTLFSIDPKTIRRGLQELDLTDDPASDRVRKKGGGRQSTIERQPQLEINFLAILAEFTAGDPMREDVLWTNLSRCWKKFMTRKTLSSRLVLPVFVATSLINQANADDWQLSGTIDLSYANAFQSNQELPFRSRATSSRLNEFSPNVGMFYLRKAVSETSRWGMEIGAQAGYDTDGQVPGSERLPGYSILRYLSRANVSYLAPIGNGLTLTAGLMNSFLGFDSFYAKDNFNVTRSWGSDYSPYFLIGAGGQYTFNEKLSAGLYLVSDYDYLAYRSDQPKYAGQVVWTISPEWKYTQNLFAGPEQRNTDTANWRYFSNSIVQWSKDDLTMGLAYDVGTERLVAEQNKQTLWMSAALPGRWHIDGPWSVALRPELYWDGDGRMTGNRQMIKSVTATLEYKVPMELATMVLRSEYRYDDSSGHQGGFYRNNSDDLIDGQHTVFISCLLNFDRSW